MQINVGIVGLGAIGNFLVDRILENDEFSISALWDISYDQYYELAGRLESPPPLLKIDEFPASTDVFVECASVNAVDQVVREAFKRGKTVIVASIGGLMDNQSLWDEIDKLPGKLILPSGAIGGLDILKALERDDIESVTLTTRKHPRSLKSITMPEEADEFEVFNGSAREAIKRFPQNINVAAILSLAGKGFDNTYVKIIADSKLERNTHQIDIISKAGTYRIICENLPFERNPATSKLAAYSIWAALKSVNQKVVLGL